MHSAPQSQLDDQSAANEINVNGDIQHKTPNGQNKNTANGSKQSEHRSQNGISNGYTKPNGPTTAITPTSLTSSTTTNSTKTNSTKTNTTNSNNTIYPNTSNSSNTNSNSTEEHYEPKSILITGGAGFIGSHVVDLLLQKYPNYRLVVLDKLDYCAAVDNISGHFNRKNLKWCRGDIRSKCLVDYLLRSEEIDTIMHFAASTHVDNSFHSSISFTSNNVVGTHVLLEASREYGKVKRFIHVSTDEVYGGETDFEREDSVLAPTNPYACTKAAAELICRGYAKSFEMPIIITRGNNVYGPRQYPDKLIAKSCCLLSKSKKAFIHGNGMHLRSYIYVTDMAYAFDVILHHGKLGGVYNVGSDEEITNLQVVKDCIKACYAIIENKVEENINYEEYFQFVKDREVNDQHYSIDCSKLKQLGWKSQVEWTEGIRKTAEWYSNEANLQRWPDFHRGLVAHPSLEVTTQDELLM